MKRIFSLLIAFILIQTANAQQSKKDLTLEEIWASPTFKPEYVDGLNSMKDGEHYSSFEEDGSIAQYSYKTGKKIKAIVSPSNLMVNGSTLEMEDYSFSADESKILIAAETEPLFRHSTKSNYYVLDLKTKKLTKLSESGKQSLATFSPTQNKLAFVRDNNLFIKDIDTGKETQVTFDGRKNEIINGATDWVYEEEFSFDKAFAWSPDGNTIAYYKFNEKDVREFNMAMYKGSLYPEDNRFKYPKAGEANAIVTLHFFDLKTEKNKPIDVGSETDQYIPRIKWTNNPNQLSFIRMNRHQNKLELMLADAQTGKSNVILTEKNETYIDVTDNLTFLADNKNFIWSSEEEGYNHLYLYDLTGKKVKQITQGNWDVTAFLGIDEKTKMLFYISAEASPMERDLYSIMLDGTNKKKLSTRKGQNSAEFSQSFKYYINTHSDANTPSYITLHSADGKQMRVLKDNARLKETLAKYNLSKKEFFKFKTTEGVELNGWMIKPPSFDPNKKYPAFLTIYGGPGHNTVNDAYEGANYLWHQMLAQQGYVVVSVDNRGTGQRGAAFKKSTYKQLGKLETIDQIESAKHLASLPYVDKTRIGVQGWSFGGYLSSLLITKGADYFKSAIAVAPVTTWRYYDSIYTERFLQTPQENPTGYDENSPINFVKNLKGKYLLVHGTADDNVHYQNAIEMINALVKANKQFDLHVYPDRNHGIYGGVTRLHLYTKMTNFIKENL